MSVQTLGVPDLYIKETIELGVAAISDNPDLLDAIWKLLDAEDIERLKDFWGTNPPTVLSGFARRTSPFPCFCVTLAADDTDTVFIDDGEYIDEDPDLDGDDADLDTIQREVMRSTFRIWVYAENPEVCAAYYRVLRRILQVARRRLETAGLNNIVLSGSELSPNPEYTPDNLFTRQVTLTALVEETWSVTDPLAVALGPERAPRLTADGALLVRHIDAGGGVDPIDPDDLDY